MRLERHSEDGTKSLRALAMYETCVEHGEPIMIYLHTLPANLRNISRIEKHTIPYTYPASL